MLAMSFASRLKRLREARGLTQRQLAERTRIEVAQVTRYERAQVLPNAETLVTIADTLEVGLDFLLRGQADEAAAQKPEISDLPLLERFRDLQKLPKRDREAVLLLIDSVLARSDVESRIKRRA
jgi:transcriptional regulator with XRE-family HTH domain